MAKNRPHALIDGYNLIKCVPLYSESLHQSLAAARTHIEAVLGAYARKTGTEITIFYDGDPEVGHPDYQQRDNVDIFFSRRPQKADDLIMERVAQKHGARWLRVVTSDREIQRCAARHKISFIDSPAFAEEVENPRQRTVHRGEQDPGSDPHWRPDREEVEAFSAVFEQPTRRKDDDRLARRQPREIDPNLTLDKGEVDEWEQLFKRKKSD
ncbi:MAG: NYN domain-containing protein [Candidatus Latescibacterota bacterium]|jgi:predicted RNA-binding protein with PIN domain